MQQSIQDRSSRMYRLRWWMLGVLSLNIMIITINNSSLNIALPTLQRELATTASDLQWIVNAYGLTLAALLFASGLVGDRVGRALVLRIGIVIFAIGSIWAATVDSAATLIAARAIIGVGGALMTTTSLAILINVFPAEERGKAFGILGGLTGGGFALGPIIGGLLIEHFSWIWVFLFNLPLLAVAGVAGAFLIPESRNPNAPRLDILGTILSGSMMTTLVYGLIQGGSSGWTDGSVIGYLGASLCLAGLFAFWESHTASPMLDMKLFRNLRFSVGFVNHTIYSITLIGLIFVLTLYMQFVLGYSAMETGERFLPLAAGFIVGSFVSNVGVARFGLKSVLLVSFLGVTALLLAVSSWETDTPYWVIGSMLFAVYFCLATFQAPNLTAMTGAVPVEIAGMASAMAMVASQMGNSIGVAALGSVVNGEYASKMKPALAQLPDLSPQSVAVAQNSVGGAMRIADRLPTGVGETVRTAARSSFMDGWQMMALVAAGIVAAGVIMVLTLIPPTPLSKSAKDRQTKPKDVRR